VTKYIPAAAVGARWSSASYVIAALQNAARIRSIDVDGVDGPDLAIVCSDQRTVNYLVRQPDGSFLPRAGFTMPHDVLDIVPVALDAEAGEEMAILCTNGVHLREPEGTPIAFARCAFVEEMAICAYRPPNALAKVLFTTFDDFHDEHVLHVVGTGGPELTLDLGYVQPVAIEARDWDGDGKPDLLMTERHSYTLRLYPNVGTASAPAFTTWIPIVAVSGALPVVDHAANAAWVDANLDGKLDVFVPVKELMELRGLIGDAPTPPGSGQLVLLQPHPAFRLVRYPDATPFDLELNLFLDNPATANYTHVEVGVWVHYITSAFTQPATAPPALVPFSEAAVSGPDYNFRVHVPVTPDGGPLPLLQQNRYYMTVRLVQLSPTSAITASSQVFVGGFCGGNNQSSSAPSQESILLNADAQFGWTPIPFDNLRIADTIGLFVALPAVPHFVPGLDG
jgi:hypothetical protein